MWGTTEERFLRLRAEPNENGCTLFGSAPRDDRYSYFTVDGSLVPAHRYAWERENGPVPDGLVVDHVHKAGCRSKACVNTAHLEPVTQSENILRGCLPQVMRDKAALITHCPKGHAYDEANTRVYKNNRRCRACARDRERAKRETRMEVIA